jgi:isovaleryl-CoA dehydrogenase
VFTASMNFGLGEEIDALRDTVSRFAADRIAPVAEETDRDNQFPMHLWQEMGALGLLGMTADPDFGGTGMGYLEHVVAMEEISRASASVGLSYGAHSNLCVNQINRTGAPRHRSRNTCRSCAPASMSARWPCRSRAPAPTWCR